MLVGVCMFDSSEAGSDRRLETSIALAPPLVVTCFDPFSSQCCSLAQASRKLRKQVTLPCLGLGCLAAYSVPRLLVVIEDLVLCSNLHVTFDWMGAIGIVEGYRRSACLLVGEFLRRVSWRCVLLVGRLQPKVVLLCLKEKQGPN
jgi:hypothetical protein